MTATAPRTQAEVDRLINVAIEHAGLYEVMRDAEQYESAMYWHYHDCAIEWHRIAEGMMPRSGRTIKDDYRVKGF